MTSDLQTRLVEIRRSVFSMASIVETRLTRVVDALLNNDMQAARDVRHGDRAIDDMENEVERMCIEALALQQPVARDLRFIITVLRIIGELERVADLTKGISKRLLHMERTGEYVLPDELGEMGKAAREMLSGTLEALSEANVEIAQKVWQDDKDVDDLQRAVRDWAQEVIVSHGTEMEVVVDILDIARCLERIGDMCTNVAEDVVFLVQGKPVRHMGLS